MPGTITDRSRRMNWLSIPPDGDWHDWSDKNPRRRIFRGPGRGPGRRGSFERHMLEGLFIKAFVISAFTRQQQGQQQSPQATLKRDESLCSSCAGEPLGQEVVRKTKTPRWKDGVPRQCLEVIGEKDKGMLFEGYIPTPANKLEDAADVIARLKALSPGLETRFAMKAGSREALVFRLLFPYHRPRHDRKNVDGYYALSYRWQSHPTTSDPRVTNCRKYAIGIPPEQYIAAPVSDGMLEAVMEELPEGNYGLWCDQICIDESNDEERNTAVSMMDSIYRAAKKVIIALDDVEIDGEEVEAMVEFSDWHDHHTENGRVPEDTDLDYMKDKPRLRSCVEKIVYSEYFDRAWCAHEFELAVDRVVLVRTSLLDEDGNVKVIRIEDDKLHSLMLLLTLLQKKVVNPTQAARRVNVELLASRDDRDGPGLHSQLVHDMQTLALIMGMKTGGDPTLPERLRPYSGIRDKMSIMLNASDMALVPAADLAIEQLPLNIAYARIYEYISLLMLAAGNPLILTTTSRAVPADMHHESWLRKFWLLDAAIEARLRPLERPLPIRVDPNPGCRWIELDLMFPKGGDGVLHTASPKFLKHATNFVTDFRNNNPESIEPEAVMPTTDAAVTDARRDYITHLMACILECRWTWGYGAIPLGVTTPSPTSPATILRTPRPKLRMKYSTEEPWSYFFGDDLDRIPESISWTRKDKGEQEQKTAKDMAGELMSGLLMTAPLPETRGDTAMWRPAWFEVGGGIDAEQEYPNLQRTRYIAMVPRDGGPYRAAIPRVLRSKEYKALARCWILEEKGGAGSGEWVVRNRSKLIIETDTLEQELKDGLWDTKAKQKAWGRTHDWEPDEAF